MSDHGKNLYGDNIHSYMDLSKIKYVLSSSVQKYMLLQHLYAFLKYYAEYEQYTGDDMQFGNCVAFIIILTQIILHGNFSWLKLIKQKKLIVICVCLVYSRMSNNFPESFGIITGIWFERFRKAQSIHGVSKMIVYDD